MLLLTIELLSREPLVWREVVYMKIVLDTKTIAGLHMDVTESIKQYYNIILNAVIDKYMSDLEIESLNEIIITDRLSECVKAYQREHGLTEELTDNEFGRVFGKTIFDSKTGKHSIFLNAEEATFLLDDSVIDRFHKGDEEGKKNSYKQRDHIINLLAHELSHVEYNSLITTIVSFSSKNPYDEYLKGLAIIMFEEYYACRRASEVSIPFYDEYLKDSIKNIESNVEKLVYKFRTNELRADIFRARFLERLQMTLDDMCYLLGDTASREHAECDLKNTKLHGIVGSIKREFNELYFSARNQHQVVVPLVIRNDVIKYYMKVFDLRTHKAIYCSNWKIKIKDSYSIVLLLVG